MTPSLDVQLFWVAFAAYFFGWLAFTAWLAVRRSWLTTLGSVLFVLGFVPQTVAFVARWIITGHFPMSNMYEYLAVMSWMAVLSFGIITWRYRHWTISALISPIVVMLMVAASLLPKEPNLQLMPALQSYWLYIHVSLASIGAGAFAVAAAVSMLFLLVAKEKEDETNAFEPSLRGPFVAAVIIPVVLALVAAAGGLFVRFSQMSFFGSVSAGGGSALILLGIYLPLAGFVWAQIAHKESSAVRRYWSGVAFLSLFLGSLIGGWLLKSGRIAITPDSPLRIFEFFGLAFVVGGVLLFVLHAALGFGRIPWRLKLDGRLLDEVNYRAVTLGYPLYTLGALFAGAIWAEKAWGAFWSWDPKEVGALIIWLFYSAFLHARYQRGWSGTRTAVLSLIGFAMMMLSFFGNYFFGGLHSYG
ncbi:cytochrome c biogenesis protein CcsA [bacterium]|nr:cytochrome c biogenesis protein CcsA [bacterium]MBU1983366.1 cytochrome c biogenesis protein CcsA [bacterium]